MSGMPKTMSMSAPTCDRPAGGDGVEHEHIILGPGSGNVVEEVETFTYLGDIINLY